MSAKMRSVGLDSFVGVYAFLLILAPHEREYVEGNRPPSSEVLERWINVLHKPLDSRVLAAAHDEILRVRQESNMPSSWFEDMRYFLESFISAFGSGGLLGQDLEDKFLKDLDRHDRYLSRRRENHTGEHDRERIRAVYEHNSLTPRRNAEAGNRTRSNESVDGT
jgi:hypothetical protein